MTDLKTDNAMTTKTEYTVGKRGATDTTLVCIEDEKHLVTMYDSDGDWVELTPSEALGLLDVLIHERERLQQWVREEAG